MQQCIQRTLQQLSLSLSLFVLVYMSSFIALLQLRLLLLLMMMMTLRDKASSSENIPPLKTKLLPAAFGLEHAPPHILSNHKENNRYYFLH
jgi:hypothetical protein